MTKLLVSVRNAEEARLALAAGADLIDVKEPLAGSLGAASPAVIADVLAVVGRRAPVSVACGELLRSAIEVARQLPRVVKAADNPTLSLSSPRHGESRATLEGEELLYADKATSSPHQRSPEFVKAGLAGCGSIGDWPKRWGRFLAEIPAESVGVAVIYADWRSANAPRPEAVLTQARCVERAAILIDTFDKSGGGLLRLWSRDEVRALIDKCHASGMLIAVGGQVRMDDARAIGELGPDYIAVRGAVCKPDRGGDLEAEQIAHLKQRIGFGENDAHRARAAERPPLDAAC